MYFVVLLWFALLCVCAESLVNTNNNNNRSELCMCRINVNKTTNSLCAEVITMTIMPWSLVGRVNTGLPNIDKYIHSCTYIYVYIVIT